MRVASATTVDRPLFSPRQAPRLAVQGWVASRLVLLVVALILMSAHGWSLQDLFTRWDAVHYIEVATQGYTDLTQTAFFPGLPLVMAGFSLIGVPPALTGTLISLAGSGMAAWALYRLAGGSVTGALAALAWSFAPMAVFTFVPYTEAAFCALAFWAFWYARQNRWAIAAALAGGACLFRVSGLFLIGALGLLALFGRPRTGWRQRLTRIVWLAIPAAVLGAYVIFLRLTFGSWTTWFQAQRQGWGRAFDWPWNAIQTTARVAGLFQPTPYTTSVMFRWELAAVFIGLLVSLWCFVSRKIPEGGWVGVQVLALSCQIWLVSVARTMLLWFPLFVLIGGLGGGVLHGAGLHLRRAAFLAGFVLEAGTMVWWAVRFFSGAWAG